MEPGGAFRFKISNTVGDTAVHSFSKLSSIFPRASSKDVHKINRFEAKYFFLLVFVGIQLNTLQKMNLYLNQSLILDGQITRGKIKTIFIINLVPWSSTAFPLVSRFKNESYFPNCVIVPQIYYVFLIARR